MAGSKHEVSAREAILEAAICVASRDGLLAMTLDNVAREANVSKGGLIYHFASKDALVKGMIEHFAKQVEQALTSRVVDDPLPNGRWVRALVDCCVAPPEEGAAESNPLLTISGMGKFHASLLAAVAVNPALLAPLLEFGAKMRSRIQAEDPQALEQLLLWSALDGLFVWELFGLITRDDPLFAALIGRIREKSCESPASSKPPARGTTKKAAPKRRVMAKNRSQK